MASNERKMMDNALKKVVIPVLRNQGFKGSFPHFRRENEDNIDLITFQFNKWGGSFVVELAICPIKGVTMSWGEQVPLNKVTAHHINRRYRLGAKSEDEDGIWFNFENVKTEEDFEKVASNVLDLLNTSDRSWISKLLNQQKHS
ncbi:DUF4304 domain-containing protein [Heyndrickxia sp. FSL K6-6286]|uniref:DUF4304 domain-containing protein n=1 Tax=Bacillaceae TaxID=186817 RepID=UPI001675FC8D|nr:MULTISPECIES: DUF4304 domain-containing protein [unclassified Bacillus (in: firmicutes)]